MGAQQKITDFLAAKAQAQAQAQGAGQATPREPVPEGPSAFEVKDGSVVHPLIRPGTLDARDFQVAIADRAVRRSLMVVIPTGLGKTAIAALVAAEGLRRGSGKVLFLAPTKPLVLQHEKSFRRFLSIPEAELQFLTGSISPKKRKELFAAARVVFATPQVIANDVEERRYDLSGVSLVIFDEAHRGVGDYDYVRIAKHYREIRAEPLALGLTASPGGDRGRIEEVLENLGIASVEARGHADDDVKEFVKGIEVEWVNVRLPPAMVGLQKTLQTLLVEKVKALQKMGFVRYKKPEHISKKDVIEAGNQVRARMRKGGRSGYLFGAMHNASMAMHAHHCLELLETQGVEPLARYVGKMTSGEGPSRSEKAFLKDKRVMEVQAMLGAFSGISHPKILALLRVLRHQFAGKSDSLVLVFAQYRDTITSILTVLRAHGVAAERFVGQATRSPDDPGLSQKEQQEVLDRFRRGEIRVLVASSVAEEGLDIPSVDRVVFYEPIPSEIRAIQRRGRTGRNAVGNVTILVTAKTRDEAYLYAEMAREKKMKHVVSWLEARDEAAEAARGGDAEDAA
ncbi:MAG: helicase-related protein [Methanobacteriota archaeon]